MHFCLQTENTKKKIGKKIRIITKIENRRTGLLAVLYREVDSNGCAATMATAPVSTAKAQTIKTKLNKYRMYDTIIMLVFISYAPL